MNDATKPLLTIVTITRNDREGLLATLASAAPLRERADVEQIVIDGSDESHPSPEMPPGVRLVRRPPRGVSDAFNAGLDEARGAWVWFLNGGDRAHPSLDPALLFGLLATTGSDVVVFNVELDDGAVFHRPPLSGLWPIVDNWVPHQGTLMRTALAREAGGFSRDFRVVADWDLWLRVLERHAKLDMVDVPIACFGEGGISSEIAPVAREALRLLWRRKRVLASHTGRALGLAPYRVAALAAVGWLGLRPARARRVSPRR